MKGGLTICLIIIIILVLGFFLFYPQQEKTNSWLNLLKERLEERYQESKEEIQADQAWQTIKNFLWRLPNQLKEKVL